VLYHHGYPQKGGLLRTVNRAWLERLALPPTARQQITVGLAMIDAPDAQEAPITAELRRYARRQPGCKAPMSLYRTQFAPAPAAPALNLGHPHAACRRHEPSCCAGSAP
jgi:hypothetical protein